MMRVTNTMIRSNTKSNINGNKLLVDLYNTQMTTQKKITKPSDNPVIAIRSLRLSTTLSHLNQYLDKNIEDANAWLDVTFTALNNTKVVLNDIHTVCNKGANGPLTAEDRKTILSSLKSSVEQVYADGDADYSGRTVFTGYRTNKHLTFMEDSKDTTYLINESATYKDFTTKRYYSEPITVPNVVDANTAMCNAPVTETEYKSIRLAYGDIDEDNLILDIKDKNGNQINLSKNYTTEQEWEQYCGGKVVADDEIIFIRETGEFIFGKEIADQISRDDLSINISYQKTGFEGSEVRPEYYFDCVDVTRCKEAATGKVDTTSQLYKDNKIEYKYEQQDISYTVANSTEIVINTQAAGVFDPDIARDVTELINVVENAISAHDKVDDIKNMMQESKYSSDPEATKILQSYLDAAQKEADYADDNLQKTYESYITKFDNYMENANTAIANVGSTQSRLDLIQNRVENQQETFKALKSSNEDRDLSDIIIDYYAAYYAYQSSLTAAGKLGEQTLLNYI